MVPVPVARVSSVIVHRVPVDQVERFLEWQRGITGAAEAFPGYQATEVYPPGDPRQSQWVVLIHFESSEALQRWLASPARAEWTAKLPAELADFRLKTPPGGFGEWFAGLVDDGMPPPPRWKMAVAVLFGLYPTVMLLNLLLAPHTQRFGMAVSVLIGNVISVPLSITGDADHQAPAQALDAPNGRRAGVRSTVHHW